MGINKGDGGKYSNNGQGLALKGISGTQTISHFEKGHRTITTEIGLAYAEIFDVSLDFIYGRFEYAKPQYKNIQEVTGLSNRAIKTLEDIKSRYTDIEEINNNLQIVGGSNKNKLYTFMSLVLSDEDFWIEFNDKINTINGLKNSDFEIEKRNSLIEKIVLLSVLKS